MDTRTEWLGAVRVRVLLVCALTAAGLVPVLSREASWLGSWKMALDWGTSSITLLGPVAFLIFMVLGRPDNFYWGLMVAPTLLLGLAFLPRAFADLRASLGPVAKLDLRPE